MPTKMGGYLNGLVFLMFLLSVGYNNNLLLIFTLFLFGFNLMWVIQTHYHLHALKVESVFVDDNHAGESQMVRINWKKTPAGPFGWKIIVESDDEIFPMNVLENTEALSVGEIKIPSRGHRQYGHLRVATEMPFGLYRSWVYLAVPFESWTWPKRLPEVPLIENFSYDGDGEQYSLRKGPHDVSNMGPYQGESSRFISWKHYARSGDLVVKEGEERTLRLVHLRYFPGSPDKEIILSKLATQIVSCGNSATNFTLESGRKMLGPGHDRKFLTECLRELTTC